jgi:hypothetical protein
MESFSCQGWLGESIEKNQLTKFQCAEYKFCKKAAIELPFNNKTRFSHSIKARKQECSFRYFGELLHCWLLFIS